MNIRLSLALQPPLDALFPGVGDEFRTPPDTVLGVLQRLCLASEAAKQQVLRDGQLSPFVHVFLNGNRVAAQQAARQALRDGDELCLLTAIRGG